MPVRHVGTVPNAAISIPLSMCLCLEALLFPRLTPAQVVAVALTLCDLHAHTEAASVLLEVLRVSIRTDPTKPSHADTFPHQRVVAMETRALSHTKLTQGDLRKQLSLAMVPILHRRGGVIKCGEKLRRQLGVRTILVLQHLQPTCRLLPEEAVTISVSLHILPVLIGVVPPAALPTFPLLAVQKSAM
jgi:hypothetical protein